MFVLGILVAVLMSYPDPPVRGGGAVEAGASDDIVLYIQKRPGLVRGQPLNVENKNRHR